MWFKRFWVLMLSCRATLNFLPFCVTGWVLVSVKVLGWFIKHSLLVFPCSIIWPCLCSIRIMELAAILISEAGLWLPTCFSAACSVSSATSLGLRIFRNTPTLLNQAEYRWWLLKLHGLCVRRNFCQSLSPLKVWASTGKQREQKLWTLNGVHQEAVTVILSLEEIQQKKCDSNVFEFWCFHAERR